ncbi:DUF1816 domain-containing protein [Microcoleus sp. FACHB-53]|nr:DUF1816 domain-containing protein [Microcoleus sp. FACHB-53]
MSRKNWENNQGCFACYLENMGMAWWVEIITQEPHCIYYFGSFARANEAKQSLGGYIEDLEEEGAQVIAVDIKRGQPSELTIFEDELAETYEGKLSLAISKFVQACLR